jgi:cobalt/nickel transport system permease protein
MTRDGAAVLVYSAAVVAATTIHNFAFLGLLFAAASIVARRDWGRLALRALKSILLFNSIVTLSYTGVSLARGNFSPEYVALVNVRVFVLTFLTFLAARRINILKALSFSRTLSYVLTLAIGQLATFRRILDDFRMAMTSRTIRRVTMRDMYRHSASTASFLFLRALNDSAEITDGMKSRGFFDD